MLFSLVHLFLDLISHWDAFNLSMIIGWNTGDPMLTLFFYFPMHFTEMLYFFGNWCISIL
ncbi:MAG: hypothetical protein R2760_00110 [Chitinophagales bacterium]